jgi:hypothetical protein
MYRRNPDNKEGRCHRYLSIRDLESHFEAALRASISVGRDGN